MMRHHNRGRSRLTESNRQPVARLFVKANRIGRSKPSILRTDTNTSVVHHRVENRVYHPGMWPEEGEISPQGTAKETKPGNLDDIVLEKRDVEGRCPSSEFVGEFWQRFAVVLVIAGHVDHGVMRKGGPRPLEALRPMSDVAWQHNDVGVDSLRAMMVELAVQVAE